MWPWQGGWWEEEGHSSHRPQRAITWLVCLRWEPHATIVFCKGTVSAMHGTYTCKVSLIDLWLFPPCSRWSGALASERWGELYFAAKMRLCTLKTDRWVFHFGIHDLMWRTMVNVFALANQFNGSKYSQTSASSRNWNMENYWEIHLCGSCLVPWWSFLIGFSGSSSVYPTVFELLSCPTRILGLGNNPTTPLI